LIYLIRLFLNSNYFTGGIPSEIGALQDLEYMSLNTNLLSGTIPPDLGNCRSLQSLEMLGNFFTGSIIKELTKLENLTELNLAQNLFTGTIQEGLFNQSEHLTSIIISENFISGQIPNSLFVSGHLTFAIAATNCFTGTLPDTICTSSALEQLILDGLHSASACIEKAIPGLPSSGLIAKNSVHGHIPSCLLQQTNLSVLHLGGNSLSGSIPNVAISAAMTELVLSSNQLTGAIPDSIWQSNITSLDLSFNRLQGSLPSNMLPAAQSLFQSGNDDSNSSVSVKLQVNQLAGTIPGWLQSLPSGDINVLEGNLFSCNADRSDLPVNDPKAATYECGSDNTNYGLIAFGTMLFCVSIIVAVYRFLMRGISKSGLVIEMFASFNKHYGESEMKKMCLYIERAVYAIVSMWILGMIVYGLLSMQHSSYRDVYVWSVSGIFKAGLLPAVLLLVTWGMFCFLFAKQLHQYQQKPMNFVYYCRGLCSNNESYTKWSQYGLVMLLVVINVAIVTLVNALFVYVEISSAFSFQLLLFIAFGLSLFKIMWNYLLLRVGQYLDSISDTSIVFLCLFNNLLAPLLAELFVSSDCFLYIVSKAPPLKFTYNVVSCILEDEILVFLRKFQSFHHFIIRINAPSHLFLVMHMFLFFAIV
jgi:hypothetical protein